MEKFCGNCGHKLDGNYEFCPNCGGNINNQENNNNNNNNNNNTTSTKPSYSIMSLIALGLILCNVVLTWTGIEIYALSEFPYTIISLILSIISKVKYHDKLSTITIIMNILEIVVVIIFLGFIMFILNLIFGV